MEKESLEGKRLGRFRITRLIGKGGMGEVYAAIDEHLDRPVAIKVLSQEVDAEPHRRRFLREARLAARLNHPNIASIHEVGDSGGRLYIVMELLDGLPLRNMLTDTRLGVEETISIARDVARALARAHAGDVIHRDIKPENIFITSPAPGVLSAKVLDFGLARDELMRKARGDDENTATDLTGPGEACGTAGYLAPEQARGLAIDVRADIFSFGAVLYEMLTGRRAFDGRNHLERMLAVVKKEPETIHLYCDNIDPKLEEILERCLAKAPADRYADGRALLSAMEELLRASQPAIAAPAKNAHAPAAPAPKPPPPAPTAAPAQKVDAAASASASSDLAIEMSSRNLEAIGSDKDVEGGLESGGGAGSEEEEEDDDGEDDTQAMPGPPQASTPSKAPPPLPARGNLATAPPRPKLPKPTPPPRRLDGPPSTRTPSGVEAQKESTSSSAAILAARELANSGSDGDGDTTDADPTSAPVSGHGQAADAAAAKPIRTIPTPRDPIPYPVLKKAMRLPDFTSVLRRVTRNRLSNEQMQQVKPLLVVAAGGFLVSLIIILALSVSSSDGGGAATKTAIPTAARRPEVAAAREMTGASNDGVVGKTSSSTTRDPRDPIEDVPKSGSADPGDQLNEPASTAATAATRAPTTTTTTTTTTATTATTATTTTATTPATAAAHAGFTKLPSVATGPPAPSSTEPRKTTGTLHINATDAMTIVVDGEHRRLDALTGNILLSCGRHRIRVGLKPEQVVDVPCGGLTSL